MKRGENSGAEKPENLGEKLKKELKKGGNTTPVIPFWRIQVVQHHQQEQILAAGPGGGGGVVKDNIIQDTPFDNPCVSARKLGATLWELDHYKLPFSKMQQNQGGCGSGSGSGPPLAPRLRRLHHHHHGGGGGGGGGFERSDPLPGSPDDLPESASTLRRHVAASIMKHHRAIERNNHAIRPVSPASYSSSMEIGPYNYAVTPSSTCVDDLKGKTGEASYSLKTSSELLKVLNRIWSLEEQHASNMSLVKGLKKELDHARVRIKELMRDQRSDRHGINQLMKQFDEDKLVRKNKERDRINNAVQSVRDELEDERKLRKRSETLHRRLAREIHEVKTSLAFAVKDRDKERKSRMLLEDLCDEFALGIRDYEQELHGMRHKFDADHDDRLILHVSESWLDQRIQMKQETQNGSAESISVLDKLSSEIETFLLIKHKGKSKSNSKSNKSSGNFRRSSLESIPLNIAASAPPREDDDNDSIGSDSHCFELPKPTSVELNLNPREVEENHVNESRKPDNMKTNVASQGATQSESWEGGHPVEGSISKKSEIHEATEDGGNSEKKNTVDASSGLSSNFVINNLITSHYTGPPEQESRFDSGGKTVWKSQASPSPVRQWTDELPSNDRAPDLKENTLKAKLTEARSKAHRPHSRLKASKVSL